MSGILVTRTGIAVCGGCALHTIWPRLVRSALAAKNSVPHCFFNAATLSGSIPRGYSLQIKNR